MAGYLTGGKWITEGGKAATSENCCCSLVCGCTGSTATITGFFGTASFSLTSPTIIGGPNPCIARYTASGSPMSTNCLTVSYADSQSFSDSCSVACSGGPGTATVNSAWAGNNKAVFRHDLVAVQLDLYADVVGSDVYMSWAMRLTTNRYYLSGFYGTFTGDYAYTGCSVNPSGSSSTNFPDVDWCNISATPPNLSGITTDFYGGPYLNNSCWLGDSTSYGADVETLDTANTPSPSYFNNCPNYRGRVLFWDPVVTSSLTVDLSIT